MLTGSERCNTSAGHGAKPTESPQQRQQQERASAFRIARRRLQRLQQQQRAALHEREQLLLRAARCLPTPAAHIVPAAQSTSSTPQLMPALASLRCSQLRRELLNAYIDMAAQVKDSAQKASRLCAHHMTHNTSTWLQLQTCNLVTGQQESAPEDWYTKAADSAAAALHTFPPEVLPRLRAGLSEHYAVLDAILRQRLQLCKRLAQLMPLPSEEDISPMIMATPRPLENPVRSPASGVPCVEGIPASPAAAAAGRDLAGYSAAGTPGGPPSRQMPNRQTSSSHSRQLQRRSSGGGQPPMGVLQLQPHTEGQHYHQQQQQQQQQLQLAPPPLMAVCAPSHDTAAAPPPSGHGSSASAAFPGSAAQAPRAGHDLVQGSVRSVGPDNRDTVWETDQVLQSIHQTMVAELQAGVRLFACVFDAHDPFSTQLAAHLVCSCLPYPMDIKAVAEALYTRLVNDATAAMAEP